MNEKDINNLKEMLVDFNEYSTDYTKTRCRELEETIENTLKEIERLNNIIKNIEKERCNLHNANGLLENAIDTLRKRNEEIYEGFMATQEELKEYAEENERLNNIINEFEKWLEEQLMYFNENNAQGGFSTNVEDLEIVKDKLHELKGSE